MLQRLQLVFFLIAFSFCIHIQAQETENETSVIIHSTRAVENTANGSLEVEVYLSIVGTSRRVLPDIEIESASLGMGGEVYVDEEPIRSREPVYIVLLVDVSNSMQSAIETMKIAAQAALEEAPSEALFALIPFASTPETGARFRTGVETSGQIANLGVRGNDTQTCLYTALAAATSLLAEVGQRRSIIVFSDGHQTTGCSNQNTADTVLAEAERLGISIHAIGLDGTSGNYNSAELDSISARSHGLSLQGDSSVLEGLFTEMMRVLSSQWLLRFTTYPSEGTQSATLTLTLANGGYIQPVTLEILAGRNYLAPVIELQIAISSIAIDYQSEPKRANLSLSLGNPLNFARLDIRLLSEGVELRQYTLEPSETLSIELPELVSMQEYQLRLSAWDANNRLIAVGETDYQFTYLRPQPSIIIQSVEIDYEAKFIHIRLELEQGEEIASYAVWLFNAGNLRIASFEGDGMLPTELQIPFETLANESHHLSIQVFDSQENPLLLETATWEFEAVAPEKPWYEGLTMLRSNLPFIITAILIIVLLLVLAWNTFRTPRKRIKVNLEDKKIWTENIQQDWKTSVNQAQMTIDNRLNELPIAVLRVTSSTKEIHNKRFDIKTDNEAIRIGRSTKNNDFAFEEISRISDKHVIIHQQDQRFFIEDVQSANGTSLNDSPIKANEKHELNHLDRITLDTKDKSVEIQFVRFGS